MFSHYAASTTSKLNFSKGQTVQVTDGEFKGQLFTVKFASISHVTLIRDTTKPASFYNTLTLPNSKVTAQS